MHILFLAEGYSDFFDKFEKEFHGKIYANGKAKLRVREFKLYNFGINEEGYNEFLSDIKSFSVYDDFKIDKNHPWDDVKQSGQGLKNKLRKIIKWMRKIFPQIKDIENDMIKAESTNLSQRLAKEGKHFLLSLHPIGKVNDARYKNGEEVV